MGEITGFGSGGFDVSMSKDRTQISITSQNTPIPMRYRVAANDDGTLKIVNLDDTSFIVEEIEKIIGDHVYSQWDEDYDSYELIGINSAAYQIFKLIEEHFVRKD